MRTGRSAAGGAEYRTGSGSFGRTFFSRSSRRLSSVVKRTFAKLQFRRRRDRLGGTTIGRAFWVTFRGREADAVADAARGSEVLCDRSEDSSNPIEEEDRFRRARAAHGAVAGDALESRTRPIVPDAADAAADCAGVQCRPRILLRRGTRTPVVAVARHQDRLRFPEKQGARDLAYEFESLD